MRKVIIKLIFLVLNFSGEKKNEPYGFRIRSARVISEHRNHYDTEAGIGGGETEVIKPIVLIC